MLKEANSFKRQELLQHANADQINAVSELVEEVYLIPQKDLDQLIQYYKGELTENALLNKTATLATKKTCLVARPPTTSGHCQCPNQTSQSRIYQADQAHTSISWGCWCWSAWRTSGRGRRRRRGFGDGSRGTMVETYDKRQSVHPQTTNHSVSTS